MSTRRNSRQTARRLGARPRRYTPYSLYRRALRLEPLEDRRLLAVVTVNTLSDTVNFNDGLTSLREAIFATNLVGGADTINFAPSLTTSGPATIVLTQGELKITDSLTISGPGASLLTIDASGSDPTPTIKKGDGIRIFNVDDGVADNMLNASLTGLTLTGGDIRGVGGAIRSRERLTVADSLISGNSTTIEAQLPVSYLVSSGGGVFNYRGDLTIQGSTISGNSAAGAGGGIYSAGPGSNLTVISSTVSNNSAVSKGGGIRAFTSTITNSTIRGNSSDRDGGGIHGFYLTISGSTISDNFATVDGGGLHAQGDVTIDSSTFAGNNAGRSGGGVWIELQNDAATIVNTTISGNMAHDYGAGVWLSNEESTARIAHSTIYKNVANWGVAEGGGVFLFAGALTLDHTIEAANSALVGADFVAAEGSLAEVRYSLIGNNANSGLAEAPVGSPDLKGNLVGGSIHGVIDPLLGPLAKNGGRTLTLTHALLPGSPAINAGNLNLRGGVSGVPLYDQRGNAFDRVSIGRIDIGAFEYKGSSDLNLVVDTLVDESDGNYSRGDLSLREAIELANRYRFSPVNTIHFDPQLVANGPATILLTQGELQIASGISIVGFGSSMLTIDASGSDATPGVKDGKGSRVFRATTFSFPRDTISISGVTLTGGDTMGSGGAIYNVQSNLTLEDVTITGNAATFSGGGIYSISGEVEIHHSSIVDNSAGGAGGGIYVAGNHLGISDSLISGNVVTNDLGTGGGIYVHQSGSNISQLLTVSRSTISNNVAKLGGGGITARGTTSSVLISESKIFGNLSLGANTARGGGLSLSSGGTATIDSSRVHDNRVGVTGVGGGVYAFSQKLVVINSTIASNFGGQNGGGIYAYSALQVTGSVITGNSTQDSMGGGGIASGGTTQIVASTIADNLGNGIRQRRGSLSVTDSIISGNSTSNSGGGIYASGEVGDVTITRTQITDNHAALDGGGIQRMGGSNTALAIFDGTISHNSAQRDGGGINVVVPGNAAAKINRTEMDGNSAGQSGGGIFKHGAGSLDLSASTLSANVAAVNGGGIAADEGTLRILTSTVSGNSAAALGGGVWAGQGATFTNSTVFGNHAGVAGGGVFVASGPLSLDHTIVASDTAPAGPDVTGLLGATITAKYSLLGSNAGSGLALAPVGAPDSNGNIIGGNIDPKLGPLSMNAGPTAVHVPLLGSPVINAGDPTVVSQGTSDQRDAPFTRVYDGRIDIGSVEAQPNPLLGDYDKSGSVDAGDFALWRKTKGSGTDLRADGNGDRLVNNADYELWRAHFGESRTVAAGFLYATSSGASGAFVEVEDVAASVVLERQPTNVLATLPYVSASPAKPPRLLDTTRCGSFEPASAGLLAWLLESGGTQEALQKRRDVSRATANEVAKTNVACAGETIALDEAFAMMSRSKIGRAVFARQR